jgi:hypothetical protein
MFERHFQRAMKYGARLLFLVAVMLVILSFVDGVQWFVNAAKPVGGDRSTWLYHVKLFWTGLSDGWPELIGWILRGLSSATLPFFGALVVYRIDQWMAKRADERPSDV